MVRGTGELSVKAGQIREDFLERYKASAEHGIRSCDVQSVVENNVVKITPLEPAYVFNDYGAAMAVSKHLKSVFRKEGFKDIDIWVKPAPSGDSSYHLLIKAAW